MEITIAHLAFLFIGLAVGGTVIWYFIKSRLALAESIARNVSEAERAALIQQLKTSEQELLSLKQRLSESERHVGEHRSALESYKQQCAQLIERTKRLGSVEAAYVELRKTAESLKSEVADWREANGQLTADAAAKQQRLTEFANSNQRLSNERDGLLRDQADFRATIEGLKTTVDKERSQTQKDLDVINGAREQLSIQFQVLANKILEENGKKFAEQNKTSLGHLLEPLQEKLKTFQSTVEKVYVEEGKDRRGLAEQVKMLTDLNATLSLDAKNLTNALTGNRKTQGNWGEIILDDVLERAGLIQGQHYVRQGSVKAEDGQTHVIPDVVIRMPGNRQLVVDAKMTLPDYRAFASSASEEDRGAALKRHNVSIRAHIKGLSEKNYQILYGLNSLDFVIMFVPLEPAFMLAVTNDQELFQNAWEKNVLLVSPSTLLFVVRTVAHLWRQEDLSRNAKDISDRGAELYDKLVGFIQDLQKVGDRIHQAQESFIDAKRKLSEGHGNVVRQAELLKKLGVKPTKSLPPQWVDTSLDDSLQAVGGGP